ncbi:iduronate-2-sulfatase [Amylibacter ulvae]|uniref:Iduronate-2-sulfatase n=1 Tax=Paramylibacter ulvae TaxID=1651968 RepID=A0ABQ3D1I4_9RHOB|nr:sulfatase [Amylibacter ulvae]GHA53805.1 iduronate-2-sulfatase [Amylibacter ulvae]
MSVAKNILFLSIEDLNDWVEPLRGHPQTITPNITRLANRGMLFENAYAPVPACSPSRTATLFGQNPWETGIYANAHKWHDVYATGARKSLVGRMRDAGFDTYGAGKVFHQSRAHHDANDWTDYNLLDQDKFTPISRVLKNGDIGHLSDFGACDDVETLNDERNTDWICDHMKSDATGQFWALGLYRPHLPFIVPKRFFDMFDGDITDPPGLGANQFDPDNLSPQAELPKAGRFIANRNANLGRALHKTGEYKDFIRAYLASIAYADHLLGRVLDRMDEQSLWENTLVVLWSDHGWELGEKLTFRKFSLWERALRVPLIFAGAGIDKGKTQEPVSLIDIAPTLFAQSGLPKPDQFSGQDLSPLFKDPDQTLRGHAVSIWGKNLDKARYKHAISVRTRDYRHILYWDGGHEFYDHRVDPFEHCNRCDDPTMDDIIANHLDCIPAQMAQPITFKS